MNERDEPLAPGAAPATVDLPGRMILVVGPAGTTKDDVIAAARAQLAGDDRWVFPRRIVTRPIAPRENAIGADEASFLQVRARGGFALAWTAGGAWYGIPASVDADLARGSRVVIEAERSVIAAARRHWPDVTVIEIAAPGATVGDGDPATRRGGPLSAFLAAVLAA